MTDIKVNKKALVAVVEYMLDDEVHHFEENAVEGVQPLHIVHSYLRLLEVYNPERAKAIMAEMREAIREANP